MPEDSDLLLSYHDLARTDVQHDDDRRWTLFAAFLVAETLLTTLLGRGHDALTAGLGVLSTVLIGLAAWRNNVYLRDRSLLAAALERRVGPRDLGLRFYDARAQLPRRRLYKQKGYGILRDRQRAAARSAAIWLQAWAMMRIAYSASVISWLAVFLVALRAETPVVIAVPTLLGLVVLIDWVFEIRQRIKESAAST